MKVTLLKDVLTPRNGVGRIGQTVDIPTVQAKEYIKLGFAEEAADDAEALPPDDAPPVTEPITRDSLKQDKKAASRTTKPTGPEETK